MLRLADDEGLICTPYPQEGMEGLRAIKVDGIRGSTLRFAVQAVYAREVTRELRFGSHALT